jgi:hypothetical protein
MSEVLLKGGPMDGRTMNIMGYGTKVALGWEYGWTFACGAPAYASGMYLRDGSWQDSERNKKLSDVCVQCQDYGTHDLGIGEDNE